MRGKYRHTPFFSRSLFRTKKISEWHNEVLLATTLIVQLWNDLRAVSTRIKGHEVLRFFGNMTLWRLVNNHHVLEKSLTLLRPCKKAVTILLPDLCNHLPVARRHVSQDLNILIQRRLYAPGCFWMSYSVKMTINLHALRIKNTEKLERRINNIY